MLNRTLAHFGGHAALWNAHGPILANVAALQGARDRMVEAAADQAEGDTRGLTADKAAARAAAAALLTPLGQKVSAFALATGDEDLRRAVDFSRSEWERMSEAAFASQAATALDRTEARLAELGGYGVAAEDLTAARDAVAAVGALAERRDTTDAEREVATDAIAEAYSEDAVPALDQLDRLVPALVTDAAFVATYREVREVPGD